jgi:glycerol uptake facilitator-like aquaporin
MAGVTTREKAPAYAASAPRYGVATLMVMIYAGGHISGGHYNPAVTLAALVRRRIGISDAGAYWIAQPGPWSTRQRSRR